MNGEYWYKYIKEHKPDVLGKDIIEYVEQLRLDKEKLQKQLDLHVVSQQRELLNSFAEAWNVSMIKKEYILDSDIDRFIEIKTI